jgi:hypothetical protein
MWHGNDRRVVIILGDLRQILNETADASVMSQNGEEYTWTRQ